MSKRQLLILVLNGPNLNLLGKRKPELYGKETLSDILQMITQVGETLDIGIQSEQSNHEGELIDLIQKRVYPKRIIDGIILNAGGYTHTSIALRDAVEIAKDLGVPTIEVHLSDIHKREPFRHISFLTPVCIDQVCGLKAEGYIVALKKLVTYIREKEKTQ